MDTRGLPTQVRFKILGDLPHHTLERKLAEEQIKALLVPTNLAKSDGSGTVTVGLLDASRGRTGLAGSHGGELITGDLPSRRFACSLLGSCHGLILCSEEREVSLSMAVRRRGRCRCQWRFGWPVGSACALSAVREPLVEQVQD